MNDDELKEHLDSELAKYMKPGGHNGLRHYSPGPEPAYPECEECLKSLDYGLIAWERHLEKAHSGDLFLKVPFCSTIRDAPVHMSTVQDVLNELEDTFPSPHKHVAKMAVKLGIAITLQGITGQRRWRAQL